MKIHVPICGQCSNDTTLTKKTLIDYDHDFGELNDDLTIGANCRNGHITVYFLNKHKFDVLFDYAVSSIVDQNRRAAFVNFLYGFLHIAK